MKGIQIDIRKIWLLGYQLLPPGWFPDGRDDFQSLMPLGQAEDQAGESLQVRESGIKVHQIKLLSMNQINGLEKPSEETKKDPISSPPGRAE